MDVYIKYPNTEAPVGTHYVVARNGLHLQIKMDWVQALVPVKEFKALEPVQPGVTLLLPPISAEVFIQICSFFRAVFLRYGTEAVVLLHYSHEQGWTFTVPQQKVSRTHVKYEMIQRLEGYRCVGTIHSHADMRASHSHTDIRDEANFDGVHITIGTLDQYPKFSMEAEIVVRGTRFPLPIEQIEGVIAPEQSVKKELPFFMGGYRSALYSFVTQKFDLDIPEEWMAQVQVAERTWRLTAIVTQLPEEDIVLKKTPPLAPAVPQEVPPVQVQTLVLEKTVPTPPTEEKLNVPLIRNASLCDRMFPPSKPKEKI